MLSLRNSLLKEGSFSNEQVATQQVVNVVNFDVHLHLDREGRRYVERVTQIRERPDLSAGYELIDLVVYENGSYRQLHRLDDTTRRQMERWMSETERKEFRLAEV